MQSVVHLDDLTVGTLVDPPAAERAVWDAFAAWGRGEAATTPRIRASVGPTESQGALMASAMAAVLPPYCGGKLYATVAGRFTFLNVLFGSDGAVLATLDGGVVTQLRTGAATSLAVHHLAPPKATVASLVGTGNVAWAHADALNRNLPGLRELRICGRNRDAAERLAARVGPHATVHTDPAAAVSGSHVI